MNRATNFDVLCHNQDILVVQTHAKNVVESSVLVQFTKRDASAISDATLSNMSVDNSPSYGDFNLGLHVNDNLAQVLENRARLLAELNEYLADSVVSPGTSNKNLSNNVVDAVATLTNPIVRSIHWLNQIHSNHVVDIDHIKDGIVAIGNRQLDNVNINNINNINQPKNIDSAVLLSSLSLTAPDADSQISRQAHKALAVMTADCVPIVLYHSKTKQIAAIHAGWKGLKNGVIGQTLKRLNQQQTESDSHHANNNYANNNHANNNHANTSHDGWQAWIGACICQDCYEVSTDVVDKLMLGCQTLGDEMNGNKDESVFNNVDWAQLQAQAVRTHKQDANKAWLNLPAIASAQLQSYGVAIQPAKQAKTVNSANEKIKTNALCDAKDQYHYSCSYGNERYYSYRRMTHQQRSNTGRMALIIVRLR